MLKIREIKAFLFGTINTVDDSLIPDGASSDSLNWISCGDKIELRRGYLLIGNEVTGAGRISGLNVSTKVSGTEVLHRTRGRIVEYYNPTSLLWEELGTNLLAAAADGEDVSFSNYQSLAGSQVWMCSPNSSLYKIMTANPTNYDDQYDSTINYKGLIKIKRNRMNLWGRVKDKTGLYQSHIEEGNYTAVTSENIGTGDGTTKTFTDTLAFKAGGAKRTCFGIIVTDTVETFTDDYSGVLNSNAGGTGTINYSTGAISVTFAAAPGGAQAITCDYQWEDATNGGLADFRYSATRLAAEGNVFPQDDGASPLQGIATYNNIEYCLHQSKTWSLDINENDTNAVNRIFREKVGVPNWRAFVETGNGIYYVDDREETNIQFRVLTLAAASTEIVPISISRPWKIKNLEVGVNLNDYRFDKAACIEFDDYVLFACRHKDSTSNNTVFAINKNSKQINKLDYWVSCFAIYGGALIAGDSVSNNVYELFSGWDDDESLINNYWISNLSELGVSNLKKTKRLIISGEIMKDQSFSIYLDIDNSGFVKVGTIEGTGDYVDKGQAVTVGSVTIGKNEVGGGGEDATAYNYLTEIKLHLSKFKDIKIKFVATGIGYVSINNYIYKDIRIGSQRLPAKYR